MTQSRLWIFIAVIAASIVIGILIGRGSSSKTTPQTADIPEITEDELPSDSTGNVAVADTTSIAETETTANANTETNTNNSSADEPILPTTNKCFDNDKDLSLQLTLFAERTEKDSVWYVVHTGSPPDQLADCAGMFLRVCQFVQSTCDQYDYPKPTEARGSRSQARWFYDRSNLVIVKNGNDDAMAKRNLIKPGAVMFFGRSGQHYNDVTIDMVEREVAHVGIVTEVKKDDAGNVIGYTMFHGRSKGKIAQRSFYHSIEPPRLGYPILGNWNQQWMAIGYVMTPKRST